MGILLNSVKSLEFFFNLDQQILKVILQKKITFKKLCIVRVTSYRYENTFGEKPQRIMRQCILWASYDMRDTKRRIGYYWYTERSEMVVRARRITKYISIYINLKNSFLAEFININK